MPAPTRKAAKAEPAEAVVLTNPVDQAEADRVAYDAVFARACLECSDMMAHDAEAHRLAAEVLSATNLPDREDAYRRLDQVVDLKLRNLLASRSKAERFHTHPATIASHVCPKRGRVLIVAVLTGKKRRVSRQSIEFTIKGAK